MPMPLPFIRFVRVGVNGIGIGFLKQFLLFSGTVVCFLEQLFLIIEVVFFGLLEMFFLIIEVVFFGLLEMLLFCNY